MSNTFYTNSPTFYHNDGENSSRVDYIIVPQSLRHAMSCSTVWTSSGDKLQPINTMQRRDHRLVVLDVDLRLRYNDGVQQHEERWDHDKISRCVLHGKRRKELVQRVERKLDHEQLQSLVCKGAPDALYEYVHESILEVADDMFRATRRKPWEECEELTLARKRRMEARGALRRGADEQTSEEQLLEEVKVCTAEVKKRKAKINNRTTKAR
eukprot:3526583-Heterocapsa_arctica.AAC.1